MQLGLERVVALFAGLMVLDIAAGVRAVRHLVERHVGDFFQSFIQLLVDCLLLRLQRRNRRLGLGDLSHQLRDPRLVFCLLCLADLLRRRIASCLPTFMYPDNRAPTRVDRDKVLRQRLQPTPFQASIEGLRMLANPFDVVHGGAFSTSCGARKPARHPTPPAWRWHRPPAARRRPPPSRHPWRLPRPSPSSQPLSPTRSSPRTTASAGSRATSG